jgi:hypothetical protein
MVVCAASLFAAEHSTNTVPTVAITNLLASRKMFSGKRIEVRGYYKSGFESSALYTSREDAENECIERSLWIDPVPKRGRHKRIRFIKEGNVRVVGVFHYDVGTAFLGVGHLNLWPGEIVALEVFEETK